MREGKTAELVPPYLNEHPHELKTGPFYLVPAVGIANTFGGPKIDANARVVNTEDRPIPGLYAAGAAAGGIWYAADVSGSQLGGCMVFGRLRVTPRLVRRRLDREERKYVRHEETGACRRRAMIAAAATAASPATSPTAMPRARSTAPPAMQ